MSLTTSIPATIFPDSFLSGEDVISTWIITIIGQDPISLLYGSYRL